MRYFLLLRVLPRPLPLITICLLTIARPHPSALAAQGASAGPIVSLGIARTNIGDQVGPAMFVGAGFERVAQPMTASARVGWSYSYLASSKCIELIIQDCGPGGFPHLIEAAGSVGLRSRNALHLYAGIAVLAGRGNSAAEETSAVRFMAGVGLPLAARTSLDLEIFDGPQLNGRPLRVARAVVTRHRGTVRRP